jgi:hypothetical protein
MTQTLQVQKPSDSAAIEEYVILNEQGETCYRIIAYEPSVRMDKPAAVEPLRPQLVRE